MGSWRWDHSCSYRMLWSSKPRLIIVCFWTVAIVYAVAFILPVRNVVLSPWMRYAWNEVDTSDLIRLYNVGKNIPEGMFHKVECDKIRIPKVRKEHINASAILSYPQFNSPSLMEKVMNNHHGRYLPALNVTRKVDYLYLYLVLAEALNDAKVDHFLVAGTLLGLMRHGGIVPWDDDIDVSMSIEKWEVVKQTLSCVQGFYLRKESTFHWKFSYVNTEYPFVDMFFFENDDTYAWALTHYTRITYIYPTHFVFPLTTAVFEGLKVPVPRDSLSIAKRIYQFDDCQAFSTHINTVNATLAAKYPDGYSVKRLQCKDLSYMYTMYNL